MTHNLNTKFSAFILMIAVLLAACSPQNVDPAAVEAPAQLQQIEGAEFSRVILSERAAERLDVQTTAATEAAVSGGTRIVVPYSALLYGLNGETWIYTSPEPLTFERMAVTVDYIEDNMVYLTEGPTTGTAVASVAVAELYGIDTGVGK